MICPTLQRGLLSLLGLKALTDTACLSQATPLSASARINSTAVADSCLLTHVKHPLGNVAQFNIPKLASKQLVLNNDGSRAGVMLVAGFSLRTALCTLLKPVLRVQID